MTNIFLGKEKNMELGNRLRELRNAKNMTQKDLADMLFVTPQAVSKWESDSAEPSLDILGKIAAHFGVSVDYLIGKDVFGSEEAKDVAKVVVEKKVETGPVLAVCESCNTPIYNGNDIVRHSHRYGRGRSTSKVTCRACDEKARQVKLEYDKRLGKQNRVRSYWLSGIIAAIVLTLALVFTIPTADAGNIIIGVVISILSFTFASCLFLRNNFVGEMVGTIFDWGIVKFPGIIFELDLDGILWLLTVKLLFWIIGFIVAFAFLFLGVALGLAVSIFVYPFAIRKSILYPEIIND